MKSTISCLLVAIVIATCGIFATVVRAQEYSPLYTFNQGIVEDDKTCTAEEWTLVQDAMAQAMDPHNRAVRGRGLRRLASSSSTRHERKLRCDSCGGRPLCLMRVGYGCARRAYRRNRGLLEHNDERNLAPTSANRTTTLAGSRYQGVECRNDVNAIDLALDEFHPLLSVPCQDLISAQRRIVTCAELTHAQVVKCLDMTSNNNTVCVNNSTVALQADSNFFLGDVTFELRGPNGYTHTSVGRSMPYSAFGKWMDARNI